MKINIFRPLLIVLLFLCIAGVSSAWAGQVVTEEVKSWAKTAVQQEKSLSTVKTGNTLAVLYFHNNTGKSNLNPIQKGFAFMLMTDLSQVKEIQLVERVKMQALVEELNLGTSGLVDQKTAPRVGKLLGARYLVGGDIAQGKIQELGITSDVVEVPVEKSLGRPSTEGSLDKLFELEKQVLFEIIRILQIKLTPEQKKELERPLTKSHQALLNLFNAIDSSDQGNFREAERYYKKALMEDPGLNTAKDALNELKKLNLVKPRERGHAMLKTIQNETSRTNNLTLDYSALKSRDPNDVQMRENRSGQIDLAW